MSGSASGSGAAGDGLLTPAPSQNNNSNRPATEPVKGDLVRAGSGRIFKLDWIPHFRGLPAALTFPDGDAPAPHVPGTPENAATAALHFDQHNRTYDPQVGRRRWDFNPSVTALTDPTCNFEWYMVGYLLYVRNKSMSGKRSLDQIKAEFLRNMGFTVGDMHLNTRLGGGQNTTYELTNDNFVKTIKRVSKNARDNIIDGMLHYVDAWLRTQAGIACRMWASYKRPDARFTMGSDTHHIPAFFASAVATFCCRPDHTHAIWRYLLTFVDSDMEVGGATTTAMLMLTPLFHGLRKATWDLAPWVLMHRLWPGNTNSNFKHFEITRRYEVTSVHTKDGRDVRTTRTPTARTGQTIFVPATNMPCAGDGRAGIVQDASKRRKGELGGPGKMVYRDRPMADPLASEYSEASMYHLSGWIGLEIYRQCTSAGIDMAWLATDGNAVAPLPPIAWTAADGVADPYY